MTEAKSILKNWPRFSYVPRRSAVAPQTIRFSPSEGHLPSIIDTDEPISSFPLHDLSQHKSVESQATTETTLLSSNDDLDASKIKRIPTPSRKNIPLLNNRRNITKQKGPSSNDSKRCCNRLTTKQKLLLMFIIIFLLIIAVAAAVVPPIYLLMNREILLESSFTNITASTCSATTCIGKETPYRTSMITVLYPFDGNPNDLSGYATGTVYGAPAPGYSASCYVGTYSLNLASAAFQYVQIPYVDLTQSFTIEVWLYPQTSLVGDYGIFGQYDSNSNYFSISLRNGRFTLSFNSMNTSNITLASSSAAILSDWTHLTVAYDAVLFQQQIYVNGHIDAISGRVAAYTGTSSGSITTIGRSISLAYGISYFLGYIDHFTVSVGVARTACQIYNDASLVAYYPFESTAIYNDYSVNLFHGMASAISTVSHDPFGQGLYFSSGASYFQAECFPSMGTATVPFSISLWVKPDNSTNGGSLVHVSSMQNGSGNCYDLLAFSTSGALIVQLMQTISIVNGTAGPILPVNIWTHVAVVFGASNGLRIYMNGLLSTSSVGTFSNPSFVNDPQFITLGNNNPLGSATSVSCRNGSIPTIPGPYKGAIDEFRLYSRELDNEEICVLANM